MNYIWIILSYSVPARQNTKRIRFWRRLCALGAVQLKNALYILPNRPHLHEQIMWLKSEIESAGGESVMLMTDAVDSMQPEAIAALFTTQSDTAYAGIHDTIRSIIGDISSGHRTAARHDDKAAFTQIKRIRKELDAIAATDYFPSGEHQKVLASLTVLERLLNAPAQDEPQIQPHSCSDFQNRTWVTRERPYIDRLASFWLISRFIDTGASVRFLPPDETPDSNEIPFDMPECEFTHKGNLITYEVLMHSFSLQDTSARMLGDLVRRIDIQDMDVLPDDAALLKRLLDGYVNSISDDHHLAAAMLSLFDAYRQSFCISEQPNE